LLSFVVLFLFSCAIYISQSIERLANMTTSIVKCDETGM
jgi:hypothetical protein